MQRGDLQHGPGRRLAAAALILALAPGLCPTIRAAAPGASDPSTDGPPASDPDSSAPGSSDVVPAKFSNLRFEEDWSHLADPDVVSDHLWPSIKHVELSDDWTASFGGQVRLRMQSEDNKSLRELSPQRNDFNLLRTRVHGDFRHRSGLRVFIEGIDARIHGHERMPLGIDRNNADLLNAFVEAPLTDDVRLRVGRMELQEGGQRLVSPLDWGNTRRSFDGGLVRVEGEDVKTDFFYASRVGVEPRSSDDRDGSQDFGGVYSTLTTDGGDTVDAFLLALDEENPLFMGSDGGMGDQTVYTLGGRFKGKTGQTDYELWGAVQRGDRAGDDIDAYSYEARVGQTFPDVPGKPRVGLDFIYASGDNDPTDGEFETFNQHFPLGHAYLGYFDLVGRQNIIDLSPSVAVKLAERTTARVALHKFNLAESEDALFNAGGAATFADPSGTAGQAVGTELDVTIAHRPEMLAPHAHVLLGWSHFSAERHIDRLGGSGSADLVYLQFTGTF